MKIKDKISGELFYNNPVYVYRNSEFGYLIVSYDYKVLFVTNNSTKLKYTDVTNCFDIIEK